MNAFGEHSRHRFFGGVFRFMVWLLICTFFLPAPLAVNAAPASFRSDTNPDAARVHARLNGPERKAAIARAAEIDAAAREEYAKSEEFARGEGGEMIPPPSPLALSPSTPRLGDNGNSAAVAQANAEQGQESGAPLRGSKGQRPLAAGGIQTRPRSIGEIMFNAATGVVGLPGLADNRRDPYDPNADQGLGFHADGTARRADGTTGDNAASAGYDGKRAAAYAGQGLGYSPYGPYGSRGGNGLYANEPGYDPVTGQNFRYGDPTSGGRRAMGQGGYGSLDQFDPTRMMLDRGLNYGVGMVNSAAEGLFLGVMDSPYGGAKARFNFLIDWDGKINGEGDVLLPWYDSKYTTVYSQLGARSMSGASGGGEDGRGADRWIGNFGLGQRWYPYAVNDGTGEDAGTLMLGYNAFFDNDFTRSHQRGGVGVEAQYDWLRLASNYYVPLSSWKGSEDFDSRFVKERAAEGWDIRAKGYLPFYRNVAVTGAYTQWYGDHVGMFGAANLEKDPKVWSYGLEYTPIPLVSGFVNQRSTEHGRSDTELGLRFTYHFQMPWEDQIRHDKVAQLRTVGASRHEFVDRENRIILEYKAKNAYRIEYLGVAGNNVFKFRILNGFNEYKAGQQVRVSAGGGVTLAEAPTSPALVPAQGALEKTFLARAGEALVDFFSVSPAHAADFSQTYTTDGNGEFLVRLDNVTTTPVVITIQAGSNSQSFTLGEAKLTGGLVATYPTIGNGQSTPLIFTGPAGTSITWSIVSGDSLGVLSNQQGATNGSGVATATLTASADSGSIIVRVAVNGEHYDVTVNLGTIYSLVFGTVSGTETDTPFASSQTATIPVRLDLNGQPYTTSTTVTWSVVSADNTTNPAVTTANQNLATGLAWGTTAKTQTSTTDETVSGTNTTSTSTSDGTSSIQLTDIMGERVVTVQASVSVDGQAVTQDQTVTFGKGPLSSLTLKPIGGTLNGAVGSAQWATNAPISTTGTTFPAVEMCGGSGDTSWTSGDYSTITKLPTRAQLRTVSDGSGKGAGAAAGWPSVDYWTGELVDSAYAGIADLVNGDVNFVLVDRSDSVVCRR